MDFEVHYTEAQEKFRDEVSAWLDENVPPILIGSTATSMHATVEEYAAQRAFGRALGSKGWLYPSSPVAYGGGGLDGDSALVIMEEMGRRGQALPPYYDAGGVLGGVAILVWGTEEQRQRYLPPIYAGEVRGWQLLSEPSAGSDLAGVQTTAVRDGDDYILNGQKIYIGSENGADAYWTLARTGDPAARHQNLSWFWIDGETEGVSHQPMSLIGSSEKNTVFLDNVRVPAHALIGGENNGWKVANTHLELEHGFRSDMILNQAGQNTLRALIEATRDTVVDGHALLESPLVRDRVLDAYERLEIQRVWGLRNYWLVGQKTQTYEGSQAYFFDKITGMELTRLISDVAGPAGMVWTGSSSAAHGELARNAATAIGASHGGGTIDIQRTVIARRLGVGRAEAESGAALA